MFASVPGVWRVEEVRPLFEYLAARAKTDRPLRLTGFDLQATGGAALELGDELARVLGDDQVPAEDRATLGATIRRIWDGKAKPTKRERAAFRTALDSAGSALGKRRDRLVETHGADAVALLERAVENLRLWEAGSARDARMADNLLWLASVRYPDRKIAAWGATMHFMHASGTIREGGKRPYRGREPMGEAIRAALGSEAYVLAFLAHHGRKGTPFWGPFPIPPAPPESIEDLLHRYGAPLLFVDLGPPHGPFGERRQAGPLGYNRAMEAAWPEVVDGLLFTDENVPSSPLGR